MSKTNILRVLALSILAACVLVGCYETEPGPETSPLFTVTHTPSPARAVAVPDSNGLFVNHVWTFRTDVHNGLDVPIRIVSFGGSTLFYDEWMPSPSEPYTSGQFAEWYTAADPAPDGWIQPGETASDTTNWNRSNTAVSPRYRWIYEAEDEQGKRYIATREIELYPYVPDTAPWTDDTPGSLIPLTVHWEPTGGDLPAGSQIRIDRIGDDVAPLYAAYEVTDASLPEPMIRVPGLYELNIVVPGQHTASLAVLLEESETRLDLVMREAPLHQGEDPNVLPVLCDADHAYLEELMQMDRRMLHEFNGRNRAFSKHRAEHVGEVAWFEYDWAPAIAYMTERLSDPYPVQVKRLAAFTLLQLRGKREGPTAQKIYDLLPADSYVWTTYPTLAGRMAALLGTQLENDMLADMAEHHPDFYVRGFATAHLGEQAAEAGDLELSERCYRTIIADHVETPHMEYFRRVLNPDKNVRVGKMVPEFSEPLLVGEGNVTNETDAGSYRLIHYWASWCGFCKEDMEQLHAAYKRFHPVGLEIYSFSVDRQASDALDFQRQKWPMPWTNAYPQNTMQSEMVKDFEIVGIPYLVLVDPDGVVVAMTEDLKGEALEATLARFIPQG